MNGVQVAQHRSTLHPFSLALATHEFYKLLVINALLSCEIRFERSKSQQMRFELGEILFIDSNSQFYYASQTLCP